jgi:hypothetical protein
MALPQSSDIYHARLMHLLSTAETQQENKSTFIGILVWCIETAPDMLLTCMSCLVCFSYFYVIYQDVRRHRVGYTQRLLRVTGTEDITPRSFTTRGMNVVKYLLQQLSKMMYYALVYVCLAYLVYKYVSFSSSERLELATRYSSDVDEYIVSRIRTLLPGLDEKSLNVYIGQLPFASFSSFMTLIRRVITVLAQGPSNLATFMPQMQEMIMYSFLTPTLELFKNNPSLISELLTMHVPSSVVSSFMESIVPSMAARLLIGKMTQKTEAERRLFSYRKDLFIVGMKHFITTVIPEYCRIYTQRMALTLVVPITFFALTRFIRSHLRAKTEKAVLEEIVRDKMSLMIQDSKTKENRK